jgi:adenylate cyclase
LAQDKFVFRTIDHVMPKGAIHAFDIYELLGTREGFADKTSALEKLILWEEAYALYKARKWTEARIAFSRHAAAYPGDKVAGLYVKRCQEFEASPPRSSWDGVQRFDTK